MENLFGEDAPYSTIDDKIAARIFSFLDRQTFFRTAPLVNKSWNKFTHHPLLIKQRLRALFTIDKTLLGRPSWFRYRQVQAALEFSSEANLSGQESEFINQIKELIEYLSSNNLDFKRHAALIRRICDQIFSPIYHYINFRVEGIREHLATRNVEVSYKASEDSPSIHSQSTQGLRIISQTFSTYKLERLKEITAYLERIEILNIFSVLQRHAPALLSHAKNANEYLETPRNTYNNIGATLGQPPLLREIAAILTSIDVVLTKNQVTDIELKSFSEGLSSLNRMYTLNFTSDLLRSIYGSIETIVCLSQTRSNVPPSIDKKRELKPYFSFGLSLSNKISYNLLFIDPGKIAQAQNILATKKSSLPQRVNATKLLAYAAIPWQDLRNIAIMLYNADRLNRPQDETLVFDRLEELGFDYQRILPNLQRLIEIELLIARGESDYFDCKQIPIIPHLEVLGTLSQYGNDIAHLNKLIEMLDSLNYELEFLPDTTFRVFGVLGECGKNLSPQVRQLMGESFWQTVSKMRDKFAHVAGFTHQIEETLKKEPGFMRDIKFDLCLLQNSAKQVFSALPTTWSGLRDFYQAKSIDLATVPQMRQSLVRLFDYVESALSDEDQSELRATFNNRKSTLMASRDRIMAVIEGKELANAIDQKSFFEWVEDLTPLSNNQKKALKEIYKKLRQGEPAKIPDNLKKGLISIKISDNAEIINELELLLRNIKEYTSFESLQLKLNQFGLLPDAIAIWENKHRKVFEKTPKNPDKTEKKNGVEPKSVKEVIQGSIDAACRILICLQRLADLTKDHRTHLEVFWHNVHLCYAVEHNVIRIRVYVDAIEEALSNLKCYHLLDTRTLALNSLYRVLSLKLNKIRLYGNGLAHLHDVTEFNSGLTVYGQRFTTYHLLVDIIDGLPYEESDSSKRLPSLYQEIKRYVESLVRENEKPSLPEFLPTIGLEYQPIPKDGHSSPLIFSTSYPKAISDEETQLAIAMHESLLHSNSTPIVQTRAELEEALLEFQARDIEKLQVKRS